MTYTVLVQKTTGWDVLKTDQGDISTSTNPDTLLESLKTKYPASKLRVCEILQLNSDYTWSGGSAGDFAEARELMQKELL